MELTFLKEKIKLWEFCSNDKYRPAITGVCIQKDGLAVATDSFALATAKVKIDEYDEFPEGRDYVILPVQMLKYCAQYKLYKVRINLDKVEIIGGPTFPLIQEKFPDWQTVIPKPEDLKSEIKLTTAIIAKFLKAGLAKEQITLKYSNKHGVTIVECDGNTEYGNKDINIIMPVCMHDDEVEDD